MSTLEQEIVEKFHQLDEASKRRLLASLEQEINASPDKPPHKMMRQEWEAFINETYGSLADDPIERGPDLPLEIRDEIE
jgi:hypothetical protein